MKKSSYLAAAFNARPFGMPVPPNWFFVAAVAALGAFVNPGFWLMGLGLEGMYLWAMSSNSRFRATVDAGEGGDQSWQARYNALMAALDARAVDLQTSVEQQAAEIVQLLSRSGANESQIADVRQMAWLHLRLLAARASFLQVIAAAARENEDLALQERRIEARLATVIADEELTRSLERQREVIQSRRTAHADAQRRRELVEAELERLRQQIALVREQALLATDEQSVAQSLDSLSASLNEANRWLKDQRELFAGLDTFNEEAPPAEVFRAQATRPRGRQRALE